MKSINDMSFVISKNFRVTDYGYYILNMAHGLTTIEVVALFPESKKTVERFLTLSRKHGLLERVQRMSEYKLTLKGVNLISKMREHFGRLSRLNDDRPWLRLK